MIDRSRLEHRRRSKLKRRVLMLVAAAAAIGAGLGSGLVFDRVRGPEPTPSPTATGTEPEQVVPLEVTMMTLSSTFDGQTVLSSAPLLIGTPVGLPGTPQVLVTDPALRVVGPAGDAPLRVHAAGFGPQGLAGGLRNELGLRIDAVTGTTESELVRFLEQFGSIAIDIRSEIKEGNEVVYAAGATTMSASEMVTFLAFPFDDPALDASDRIAFVADAWEAIAQLPRFTPRVRNSRLPAEVRDALRFLPGADLVPLAVTDTDRGPVIDEFRYAQQSEMLEGAWLNDRDPAQRPRVDLRGRGLVQVMLLLIADGIRVDSIRTLDRRKTTIETADDELAIQLRDLLGEAEVVEPDEPLIAGLDARVTIGSGA